MTKEEVLIGDRLLSRWFDDDENKWKINIFEKKDDKWVEIVRIEVSKKYKQRLDEIFNEHLDAAMVLAKKSKQGKLFKFEGEDNL